jgi:hypothetical protein
LLLVALSCSTGNPSLCTTVNTVCVLREQISSIFWFWKTRFPRHGSFFPEHMDVWSHFHKKRVSKVSWSEHTNGSACRHLTDTLLRQPATSRLPTLKGSLQSSLYEAEGKCRCNRHQVSALSKVRETADLRMKVWGCWHGRFVNAIYKIRTVLYFSHALWLYLVGSAVEKPGPYSRVSFITSDICFNP